MPLQNWINESCLSLSLQVVRKNNTFLLPLIHGLDKVSKPGTKVTFESDQIILDELLPNDLGHFFKYSGSLTTPPCSESVTWILFNEITGISDYQVRNNRDSDNWINWLFTKFDQIKSFLRLEQYGGNGHGQMTEPMTMNVRDLQKRQKREIYVSSDSSSFAHQLSNFILSASLIGSIIISRFIWKV